MYVAFFLGGEGGLNTCSLSSSLFLTVKQVVILQTFPSLRHSDS